MMDMMSGMGLLMLLGLLLVIAVIGGTIYLVLRAGAPRRTELEGAREVLDRRLAAGEITPEEYYERESALRSRQPSERRRR